jgi:hypothetical protein
MSDTHGDTIALYERVSTIHYSHIVMVPLIISMCLSTHRNLLITRSCIHAGRLCVTSRSHGNRAFGSFASSLRSRLVALFFRSLFRFPLPISPKDIVSSKHMCDTHGGTIALYERVSTIHHPHIAMVPLIVNICQLTQRNLLIVALLHPCRTCLHYH